MASRVYSEAYFNRRAASPLFQWEADCLAVGIQGRRILEVGAGAGELARRLAHLGPSQYVTCDLVVQPGFTPDFLCDATDLPFGEQMFDLVISQHVVEHLRAPAAFFAESRRVLGPSGRVRFTTPNLNYPDPAVFDDETHISVADLDTWSGRLADAGFEVTQATSYFPYLGHPYLLYTSARITRLVRRGVKRGAVIFVEGKLS